MRQLERSRLEFYAGIILAFISLVVPMTWWLKAILAIVVLAAWSDIAFNWSIMAAKDLSYRITFCALGFVVLCAILFPPIWSDFNAFTSIPEDGSYRPLQHLSNSQLRYDVLELAARMREFETNADSYAEALGSGISNSKEEFDAKMAVQEENRKNKGSQFSNQYLAKARKFRDETIFRLKQIGIYPPYDTNAYLHLGAMPLDSGLLYGNKPVDYAADYLESLVRRLPTK